MAERVVMEDSIFEGNADSFTLDKVLALGAAIVFYRLAWMALAQDSVYSRISDNMKELMRSITKGASEKMTTAVSTGGNKKACYDFLFYIQDNIPNIVELDNHLRRHGVSLTCDTETQEGVSYAEVMRDILAESE